MKPNCLHGLKSSTKGLLLVLLLAFGLIPQAWPQMPVSGPDINRLKGISDVLKATPPDTAPSIVRDTCLDVVWEACMQCPANQFLNFLRTNPLRSGLVSHYRQTPILWYLERKTFEVLTDIEQTEVKTGVVIWQIYNMGYVVKTPSSCFGIDLVSHNSKRFAKHLDFLLITHRHADHYTNQLVETMLMNNKPVVTGWYPGTKLIAEPQKLTFGDVEVNVTLGDHFSWVPQSKDDMLMFEINCGPQAQNIVIYHVGGGSNHNKMKPTNQVDILIPHVDMGEMLQSINVTISPRATLVSHVAELSQNRSKMGYRYSYRKAWEARSRILYGKMYVPAWGDKLVFKRGIPPL